MEKQFFEETPKGYVINNIGKHNFQNLIENFLNGISITRNNEVIYRNFKATEIYGSIKERFSLLGPEFIHPEDRELIANVIKQMAEGFEGYLDYEFRFLRDINHPGVYKWVHNRVCNFEIDGEMVVLIESADITERKEMERIIRIQDKMNAVGKMAAGVAHQIRNPLSGLNIYIGVLRRRLEEAKTEDEIIRLVNQIEFAAEKIETIVEKVMRFARTGPTKAVPVDINRVVEEILELIEATLKKEGISVLVDLREGIPYFMGDRDIVEQVITNVIVNAKEALEKTEGEKAIEIKTFMRDNAVGIKIGDSGPGIPHDIRDEIFEPFFSTKKGGTGMGLALNQHMITQYGGEIRVKDSMLGGAEFVIEMPFERRIAGDG
jgi:PAS domain S-box-containing protein